MSRQPFFSPKIYFSSTARYREKKDREKKKVLDFLLLSLQDREKQEAEQDFKIPSVSCQDKLSFRTGTFSFSLA